jgi:hypothetical protein
VRDRPPRVGRFATFFGLPLGLTHGSRRECDQPPRGGRRAGRSSLAAWSSRDPRPRSTASWRRARPRRSRRVTRLSRGSSSRWFLREASTWYIDAGIGRPGRKPRLTTRGPRGGARMAGSTAFRRPRPRARVIDGGPSRIQRNGKRSEPPVRRVQSAFSSTSLWNDVCSFVLDPPFVTFARTHQ